MAPLQRRQQKPTSRRPVRVFVADFLPIVRAGVKQILQQTQDVVVAGEAADSREALRKIRTGRWDVVVLDLSMPDASPLDLVRQLKRDHPALPVLALSGQTEDPLVVRVLKAGAAGYVTKQSAPEELVHAIRQVHRGGRYLSPTVVEKLVIYISQRTPRPPHEALSDREFEVLRLLGAGDSLKQIAQAFFVSGKTISTHRHRILVKLHLKTTADLIRYALQHHLTD